MMCPSTAPWIQIIYKFLPYALKKLPVWSVLYIHTKKKYNNMNEESGGTREMFLWGTKRGECVGSLYQIKYALLSHLIYLPLST